MSQLGLVRFLSLEPARTESAAPKCFYYQEDHWRGSIVQSDYKTVVYEFIGHYFFNKATGDGGAWVTDFRVAGQTFDPTQLPGFPSAWGPYFGPGTGGFETHDEIPVDPACVALAAREQVYAPPQPAASHPRATALNVQHQAFIDRLSRVWWLTELRPAESPAWATYRRHSTEERLLRGT